MAAPLPGITRVSRRRFLCGLGLAAAAARNRPLRATAQGIVQSPRVFRSDIELVTTAVTVTDESGRLVTGLARNDFEIYEDNRPQRVAQFTSERVPVSLVLALDTSDSMAGRRLSDAHAAVVHFLDELLEPVDETALLLFNHRPLLVAPWTQDRQQLHGRLIDLYPQGGTAMYDAIGAALPLFHERRHPRGALVVISDGDDTASDLPLTDLRARLLREDVFLYAVAIDAPDARPSARVNAHALNELTGASGGYTEIVADSAELGPATARIADELNRQYMLGYSPDRPPDGRFRTIRVRVRTRDYRVRARRGYVAVPRS
jgi:Ca-activated chloride channel family protein